MNLYLKNIFLLLFMIVGAALLTTLYSGFAIWQYFDSQARFNFAVSFTIVTNLLILAKHRSERFRSSPKDHSESRKKKIE
ncbi:hypothetical protein Pan241w_37050 [Gimesia alba]|uniref:Uncharacterized protein n=1 Tax=Gimesia alba TaxID=2527973 RepID=A0A517RIC3_9PLAN|nr:hypothetical protein Pan241w_37050 [Gimesia alba]